MNISYIFLLQQIEAFASAHLQVGRFGSDFPEQMPNFATLTEHYPVLFVSPTTSVLNLNVNQFSVDIYCWDLIQDGRQNINTILSDTQLIINDLYRWFRDGNVAGIMVSDFQILNPLNNSLLDLAAGWRATFTFTVETYTDCEIPFDHPPVVATYSNDIIYTRFLTCDTLADCQTFSDLQTQVDNIIGLPAQTGHSGQYLTTNGTTASWAVIPGGLDCNNIGSCQTIIDIQSDITGLQSDVTNLDGRVNAIEADYITSSALTTALTSYATITSLSDVALSGDYNDLINTPNLSSYITCTTLANCSAFITLDMRVGTIESDYITSTALSTALSAYLPLAGGTMTGSILMNTTANIAAVDNLFLMNFSYGSGAFEMTTDGGNQGEGYFYMDPTYGEFSNYNSGLIHLEMNTNNAWMKLVEDDSHSQYGAWLYGQTSALLSTQKYSLALGDSSTAAKFTDGGAGHGIEYAADYSGGYTSRSLVDKAYVTSVLPLQYWAQSSTELSTIAQRNVVPAANDVQNLGSESLRWSNIYLSDAVLFNTTMTVDTVHTLPTPNINNNWSEDGSPFLGAWTIALTPTFGDLVSWAGDVYQNISGANGTDDPSIDFSNWSIYANQYIGTWSSSSNYALNDVVDYGGTIYFHSTTEQEVYNRIGFAFNQFTFGSQNTANPWMKLDATKMTLARIEGSFGTLNLYGSSFVGVSSTNSVQIGSYQQLTTSVISKQLFFFADDSAGHSYNIYAQPGSGSFLFVDATNQKGIQYAADYSATFINESLVTKRYVDNGYNSIALQTVCNVGNTTSTDLEITDSTKGVILKAPNGNRYRVTVDNTGNLNTTLI